MNEMNEIIEVMPWPDDSFFTGDIEFPEEALEGATLYSCTEAEYHRIKAFSSSYLKNLVDGTPHHAKTPVKASDVMKIGTGFECLAEEAFQLSENEAQVLMGKQRLHFSSKFKERCCVKPADLHKGDGARKRAEDWRARHEGKTELSMEQLMLCTEMTKSALSNTGWRRHLRGEWQTIILWVEEGVPMKAMIDHRYKNLGKNILIDLKTVSQAGHGESELFAKKVGNLKYDLQAAHYLTGAAKLWGDESIQDWVWLVVEQKHPHGSAVYVASDEILDTGFAQREKAIRNLRGFILSDNIVSGYPVYTTHDEELLPPRYHQNKYQLEELDG